MCRSDVASCSHLEQVFQNDAREVRGAPGSAGAMVRQPRRSSRWRANGIAAPAAHSTWRHADDVHSRASPSELVDPRSTSVADATTVAQLSRRGLLEPAGLGGRCWRYSAECEGWTSETRRNQSFGGAAHKEGYSGSILFTCHCREVTSSAPPRNLLRTSKPFCRDWIHRKLRWSTDPIALRC